MRRVFPALMLMMIVVAYAPDAQGATCVGQPGQGAIDQYCELVPTGGVKGTRRDRTPLAIRQELRRAGPDGEAVQALSLSSPVPAGRKPVEPNDRRSSEKRSRTKQPPRRTMAEAAPSSSLVDAARSTATSGPATGAWAPWALLVLALGAGGAALVRSRRRS